MLVNDAAAKSSSSRIVFFELTTLDPRRREFSHWSPEVLPGSHAVLFNNFSTPLARSRIEAVELSTGRRTVLVEGAISPRYAVSGHLLFVRDGAVFAVRFDARKLKLQGSPVPVLDSVAAAVTGGVAGYAVSRNGTLAYNPEPSWRVDHKVVWADRFGNETQAIPQLSAWKEPRLSPDGRWLAITREIEGRQLWLFDLNRKVLSQLTHSEGVSFSGVWMPDSRSLIYSRESPVYDLHRVAIDGSERDTIVASGLDKYASAVSADGRTLAYMERAQPDRLVLLPLTGGPTVPVEAGGRNPFNAAFSPDGRWLAYDARDASGHSEVYVRELQGQGGRLQVSADGGSQPRWTRGGKELIYRNGGAVLSVAFDPATGAAGTPTLLFRKADGGRLGGGTAGYDVTPDGSRFVLVIPVDQPGARSTTVVLHWLDRLRADRS